MCSVNVRALVISAILGCVSLSAAQCGNSTYPPRSQFSNIKVQFVDNQTGWIVGPSLFRTIDGGQTWSRVREQGAGTIVSEMPAYENKRIQFINRDVGFALGDDRRSLVRTRDGGRVWNEILLVPMGEHEPILQTIFFLSTDQGWVFGEYVYRTNNGGRTWENLGKAPPKDFTRQTVKQIADGFDPAVWFIDARNGVMARKDGDVYYTENGGESWRLVWRVDTFLTYLFFVNPRNGWLVGADGFMAQTKDGGLSWMKVTVPTLANLNSAFFLNHLIGWVAGSQGVILSTTDGGRSWNQGTIGGSANSNGPLASIYFTNESHGWAVGGRPFDDIDYSSRPSNIVLVTNDGGKTWNTIALPLQ